MQDLWLKWQAADLASIRDHTAFLRRAATNLAIDRLRSARSQRESYIGPWLPEPISEDSPSNPEKQLLESELLSVAYLFLLERLSPVARAVFILRTGFDYPFSQIADVLEKSEANCRKIFSRAKAEMAESGPPPSRLVQRQETENVARFMAAVASGDPGLVEALMAEEAILLSDGGGKVNAARKPIYGPDRITRFILGIVSKVPPSFEVRTMNINGRPGIVGYVEGHVQSVWSFQWSGSTIEKILVQVNPAKLGQF